MIKCRIGSRRLIHDIATLGKNTFCPFMYALDWLKIMQRKFLMTQYLGNDPLVSYGGSHQRSDEREADRGWFQFDYVLDLAEGTEKKYTVIG